MNNIADESPTNDDQLLLSIADTCRFLSIGRTSVYALMDAGDLDSVKLGSRRLVRKPSCVALVERLATGLD
jgi:excisionase family DNA binding protein